MFEPLAVMENFLGEYYSKDDLNELAEILKLPPLYTTLRVNTLKSTKEDVKAMLFDYFETINDPFEIEENLDFHDVLMIKAIGPNVVNPSDKGIQYNFSFSL